MNRKTLYLVHAAVIAALYVVLTLLANALGLANYAIQVRFSEALTILPFFTPAAIPGLFWDAFSAIFSLGVCPWMWSSAVLPLWQVLLAHIFYPALSAGPWCRKIKISRPETPPADNGWLPFRPLWQIRW